MDEFENIKKVLNGKTYVSFDIFDTVLLRPYIKPTDLFGHMELLFKADGFSEKRITAEKTARRKYHREITLDEIYCELDEKFLPLKEKEIEMEISLSLPNKPIFDLYKELIETKKIILISDMYLPSDVIERMLEKNGISHYHKLYVSSEHKKTKSSGQLFDLVIDDLGISKDDIVHIGDNRRSDCKIPTKKGILSFCYTKPLDKYKRNHGDEYRFYKRKRTLYRSIIVSMDMIVGMSDNVWFDMGRRFGGPLATSFSAIINNDGQDRLYMYTSRDGYNLKRISEKLYPQNKTGYIYSQRLILDVLTEEKLPYGPIELPNKYSDRFQFERMSSSMRRILNFFKKELNIEVPDDPDSIAEIYDARISEIDALRKNGFSDYSDYVKRMCGDEDINIIDCTTKKYSSQKLIENVLGRPVKGFYLVTLSEEDKYEHVAMCNWHSPVIGWMNIDVPEFFLCSPECPLSSWNNGPVFDDSSSNEMFRASVYGDVSDGELDYAEQFKQIFGEYMIPMDYWSVVKWSKISAIRGGVHYNSLKQIKWASDPDHSEYMPLVTNIDSIKMIAKKVLTSLITKINGD